MDYRDYVQLFVPLFGAMLVLLLLAKLIASKAEGRQASEADGGRLEFVPNRKSFWGVYLFVACFGYLAIASLFHGVTSIADLALPSVCVGLVAFLLMAFPATIVADDQGMVQMYWLRGRKRIAWKDVSRVAINDKTGEVTVTSKSGVKIMHTRQLPDRQRLLVELDRHCTEKMPVQAPKAMPMSEPAEARSSSHSAA
jgi:hypothetical protein